jgi:hypothetical protein
MHDPRHRRERVIADRVGVFMGRQGEFSRIGDELPPDRVVRPFDQRHQGRGDRDGVTLPHAVKRRTRRGRGKTRVDQPRAIADKGGAVRHDAV